MKKYAYAALQTIADGANALLNVVASCKCGRSASQADIGVIRLSGLRDRPMTYYHVTFDANIAIAVGGTVDPISVALLLDGVVLPGSVAIVTPAAVGDFWHVSIKDLIDVPCGDTATIAIRNNSGQPIDMQNAVLTV